MTDPDHKGSGRHGVAAWCFFDWANSPYPTVILTFVFAAYFATAIAPDPATGQELWAWAISLSGLALAVLAPLAGAIADRAGPRKPWLAVAGAGAALSAAALWVLAPEAGMVVWTLVLVGVGTLFFEFANVFYNAMLPDLVTRRRLGRVSGWGWGLGYAGGLSCLAIALVVFVQPETPPFGLDKDQAEHVRILGPLVALWFVLFALPMFALTPDRPARAVGARGALRAGVEQLVASVRKIRTQPGLLRFLIARMLYTDGLNALFALGGIFAAGAFGMSLADVLLFGVLLNVTAGIGAFGFAWVDDWIGSRRTILISLVGLTLFGAAILSVTSVTAFYVLAMLVGIFVGPAQSASRSLMARLAPVDMRTEMFGLYALSGKITAFIGPALVAILTDVTGSQRLGMAAIIVLFIAGGLLLVGVREPEGD